jgi:hypothetical protein
MRYSLEVIVHGIADLDDTGEFPMVAPERIELGFRQGCLLFKVSNHVVVLPAGLHPHQWGFRGNTGAGKRPWRKRNFQRGRHADFSFSDAGRSPASPSIL